MMVLFIHLVTIALLNSCATMSKEECQKASWNLVGFEAAKNGNPKTHFNKVNQQCSEHGVTANKEKYIEGYKEGLVKFCTYESGRSFGYNDNAYEDICPSNLERNFLRGYELGQSKFQHEKVQRELKRSQEQHEEFLEQQRSHKIYNSSNCAHITADGGCAHEL